MSGQQTLDRWSAFHAEIDRLRTLNAELVEALTTIAEHSDIHSDFPHSIENLQAYARAALAKAKGEA